VGPAISTTEFEDDVDGEPPGALPAGPIVSATEVEEDVDGGPPGGRCRQVQQCLPPSFEDGGSRSHPVSKHPTKQNVESSNYPCGARTLGYRSLLHMRVLVHIADLE
jgi:hypothetical protein